MSLNWWTEQFDQIYTRACTDSKVYARRDYWRCHCKSSKEISFTLRKFLVLENTVSGSILNNRFDPVQLSKLLIHSCSQYVILYTSGMNIARPFLYQYSTKGRTSRPPSFPFLSLRL